MSFAVTSFAHGTSDALGVSQSFPALSSAPRQYESHAPWRQRHIALDLRFFPNHERFEGEVWLAFEKRPQALGALVLDASEMTICEVHVAPLTHAPHQILGERGVKTAMRSISFAHSDGKLTLTLPEDLMRSTWVLVKVTYQVEKPNCGVYFVNKNTNTDANYSAIWTQGQDTDSHYWFPCQDNPALKASLEQRLSFPKDWEGVANGTCLEDVKEGEFRRQHWLLKEPQAAYLCAFACGELSVFSSKWKGKDVTIHLPKAFEGQAEELLASTSKMMEFYSNYWGYDYPFAKYAQAFVPEFCYGGMENTTVTLLTDQVLFPENHQKSNERRDFLIMHELAHQWFGDLLTCETWSEGWLNEGFATHSEMLWAEHIEGKDSGVFYAKAHYDTWYFGEAARYQRPIVFNKYEFASEIFDGHLYAKAAMLLNQLRDMIGEDAFRASVQNYLKTHAGKSVHTVDFVRAFEETTGQNLRGYLDQFLYRAGHPQLKVQLSLEGADVLAVSVTQTQKGAKEEPFVFEIPVQVAFENGEVKEWKIPITKAEQRAHIPLSEAVAWAQVDPRGALLAETEVTTPESFALKALASTAASPWVKAQNASALLKKSPVASSVDAVVEWLKGETLWRARAHGYKTLAALAQGKAYAALGAFHEEHPLALLDWLSARTEAAKGAQCREWALELCRLAENESMTVRTRDEALKGLVTLLKKSPELRAGENRSRLQGFAKNLLEWRSHQGLLEASALAVLSEIPEESFLPVFSKFATLENRPWALTASALMGVAQLHKLYAHLRGETLPLLLWHADRLRPTRLLARLPGIWTATQDAALLPAMNAYVNRPAWGLLSMLIPAARRQKEALAKKASGGDTGPSEIQDLKTKCESLSAEIKDLKNMVEAMKNARKENT